MSPSRTETGEVISRSGARRRRHVTALCLSVRRRAREGERRPEAAGGCDGRASTMALAVAAAAEVCIAASEELPGAGQCTAPTSVGRDEDAMRVVAGSGASTKGRYAGLWSALPSLALAAAAPDIEAGAGVVRPGCDGVADGSIVGTTGTPLPLPAAGCTTNGAVALTVAVTSGGP